MFAVIGAGGRQHIVRPGSVVELEGKDVAVGDDLSFPILYTSSGGGSSGGGSASGKVVSVGKGPKIYVQRFKRRKNYRRRTGYRASLYKVEITELSGDSGGES